MYNDNVKLTKYQRVLLDFIIKFNSMHGYSPSYREICESLHYNSTATVALHIDSLIERGYLKKDPNKARSLETMDSLERLVSERALRASKTASGEEKTILIQAMLLMGFYDAANKLGHNGILE